MSSIAISLMKWNAFVPADRLKIGVSFIQARFPAYTREALLSDHDKQDDAISRIAPVIVGLVGGKIAPEHWSEDYCRMIANFSWAKLPNHLTIARYVAMTNPAKRHLFNRAQEIIHQIDREYGYDLTGTFSDQFSAARRMIGS